MIITKSWVDLVCPKHERTSCDDQYLANHYGGWNGRYDSYTGKKEIQFPRCARCYLLDNIGTDTESLEFTPEVKVTLLYNKNY
jgi:hypothetical protein